MSPRIREKGRGLRDKVKGKRFGIRNLDPGNAEFQPGIFKEKAGSAENARSNQHSKDVPESKFRS